MTTIPHYHPAPDHPAPDHPAPDHPYPTAQDLRDHTLSKTEYKKMVAHVFIQFLASKGPTVLNDFLTSLLNLNDKDNPEREQQLVQDGMLRNMRQPLMYISWSNNHTRHNTWQAIHDEWQDEIYPKLMGEDD